MILKEAFQYKNHLNELISEAENYLCMNRFIMNVKEEHLKKKVDPSSENEIIENQDKPDVDFTPTQIIDLILELNKEQSAVQSAINEAKRGLNLDIDIAVEENKRMQFFITALNSLAKNKSQESKSSGTGYKFDADGRQTSYRYDINVTKTINYDRNMVKGLAKKLKNETDHFSMEIDRAMVTTEVNFTPKYDSTDSLEDILG